MIKCDIIIPVYNAPEYVNFCVFALFNNTDMSRIGKIFLCPSKLWRGEYFL